MHRFNCILLSLALAVGCASKATDRRSFDDVQTLIGERTGRHVQWNTGTDADRAVDQAVQQMLSRELTVDDAIQIALLNNRNLQATFEDLGVAQADLVAAGLLKNPILEGDVLFSTSGGGTGVELTVLQSFLDILWIPVRQRVAAAAMEATKARVAGEAIDLAGNVRRTYVDLQAAQQMLEMRKTVVEASGAGYDLARRLHEAGNITDLDLGREQAQYEQAKLDALQMELRVAELHEQLSALMGVAPSDQSDWTIAPRLPQLPDEETPPDQLESVAIARNLELAESRQRIAQLGEQLGISRSTALLDGAELGAKTQREVDGGWSIGPAFAIPIPLFNQGQPKIAAAQAQLRQAQHQYAAATIEIRAQLRAAQARLKAARERALAFERTILPLRQRILDGTQRQFNAMNVSVFELLVAKQQQIDAGTQYIESLRQYWQARAELEQILAGRRVAFDGGD